MNTKTQKRCSHCPGNLVAETRNESHECCQPSYVSGNLKISSLRKKIPESRSSPYDQFALAKRLHAENLEHQPLPDRVDDSVFKIPRRHCRCLPSGNCCGCCKRVSNNDTNKPSQRYGPVLGCKEPKTKMDLAICWETPIDPTYEPPRSTHIDGSEGGLAPAIFTLVEHTDGNRTLRSRIKKNESRKDGGNEQRDDANSNKCCCECLCKDLNGVDISKKDDGERQPRRSSRRNSKDDPRLIKSAVGLALGLEKGGSSQKKNDGRATVPRPRTPFARRSFCIDTLAPPFSVVNGCRDADYPEHWRLMSVYQQSYKNPYRRRNFHRC